MARRVMAQAASATAATLRGNNANRLALLISVAFADPVTAYGGIIVVGTNNDGPPICFLNGYNPNYTISIDTHGDLCLQDLHFITSGAITPFIRVSEVYWYDAEVKP